MISSSTPLLHCTETGSPNALFVLAIRQHAIGLEAPKGSNTFVSAMGWPILLVTTLTEVFRLYFGWGGNLQEQVSHMSSFLLVTAFPVFPCVLFLAFALPGRFFFEMAGGIIELVFLVRSVFFMFHGKWAPRRHPCATFLPSSRSYSHPHRLLFVCSLSNSCWRIAQTRK